MYVCMHICGWGSVMRYEVTATDWQRGKDRSVSVCVAVCKAGSRNTVPWW